MCDLHVSDCVVLGEKSGTYHVSGFGRRVEYVAILTFESETWELRNHGSTVEATKLLTPEREGIDCAGIGSQRP